MSAQPPDVAVVGAGPAGLAAATLCAEHGLATALFDEQAAPGGQVYQGVTARRLPLPELPDNEYRAGVELLRSFGLSGATHVPHALVWSATPRADATLELAVSAGGPGARTARLVPARALIVATGAQERPFPISGGTLPGVMTAGAAQILMKTSGFAPRGRTVLAGSGPLLWLVAWQLGNAGVTVDALLDTTPRGRLAQAMRHAPGFFASPYFGRGVQLVRAVRRRVRVVDYATDVAAEGETSVLAVRYTADGVAATLPVDRLVLHHGVVPDIQFASAMGCELRWNDRQACFEPVVDAWGGASIPGVYFAGDAAGIAGAAAAAARGRIAALAAVNALGRIDGRMRDRAAGPFRRDLARALRGRAFLDALHRPAEVFRLPAGDTIVCGCEEVTAAQVIECAQGGCAGPNQMKAYLRCGMGPCQGRSCGLPVTELIAHVQGRSPADVGALHARFPVKPVTLGEVAALPSSDAALQSVVRLRQ